MMLRALSDATLESQGSSSIDCIPRGGAGVTVHSALKAEPGGDQVQAQHLRAHGS